MAIPTTRATIAILAAIAAVAGGAVALTARAPAPAAAATPTALALAEHALTTPMLVADESPYELIDPVGPGGITRAQANDEVSASTMKGGLYNDNGRFGGGYGTQYFMPVQPLLQGASGGLGGRGGYGERGGGTYGDADASQGGAKGNGGSKP